MNNSLTMSARRTQAGFTLLEQLVILLILGILAAITAPSFLGMYQRMQLNHALRLVRGALEEAQMTAIRRSRRCTVVILSNKITSPDGCLVTGDRAMPQTVSLLTNLPTTFDTIVYGIKGNTVSAGTIVLKNAAINEQRCVVVSFAIGLFRTGNYTGTFPNGTCTTTE